jgi:hypothetical protein
LEGGVMKYALIKDGIVVQVQPDAQDGFVEIADDVCCGQIFQDGSFVNPPSVFDKSAALAEHRYKREIEGVQTKLGRVASDRESQTKMIAAYVMATNDPDYTVQWKTLDGFMDMTAADVIAMARAVQNHVAVCYEAEAEIQWHLDEFNTVEEIRAAFDGALTDRKV